MTSTITKAPETWSPISTHPAYEVSDQGRIRRVETGQILSVYTGDHYSKVRLKVGGAATKNVHQLVAEAFIGDRPDRLEVCHGNGDSHDNRLVNLRYDTHANNQLDQVRHGVHAEARRTHCDHGHEFTPENTRIRTGANESGRRCRTCQRGRTARRVAAGEFRKAS
jgi:HNH endonuclease/NUMOD4 motif-containing protein